MDLSFSCEEPHRLKIFVDGQLWKTVSTAIFGYQINLPDKCTDIIELERLFSLLEYQQAHHYALKLLSNKSFLTADLRRALKTKQISTETIDRVIGECSRHGYLNDHAWAQGVIRQHLARKDGPQKIARKLLAKGLSYDEVSQLLEDECDKQTQQQLIFRMLETRYRNRNLKDFRERQKVIAALIRKGFSMEDILSVFDDF